jgi:hypothetical protein
MHYDTKMPAPRYIDLYILTPTLIAAAVLLPLMLIKQRKKDL